MIDTLMFVSNLIIKIFTRCSNSSTIQTKLKPQIKTKTTIRSTRNNEETTTCLNRRLGVAESRHPRSTPRHLKI